ncbi:MAG: MFS transporter, partial [Acidobacteria bacterium]|nr:MFS transporter [Acidobacteriota bacterium]
MAYDFTYSSAEATGSRWERSFWSLLAAQFQGAFNDNALRNLAIFLLIASATSPRERYATGEIVGALFSLPFILFSMAGGYFADRYSKRSVTVATRMAGIGVMVSALAGLTTENRWMLFAAIFLMGTQSALFGPAKYGLLPELLPVKRLSWGNGLLELGTFLAIILGTVAGALLSEQFRGRHIWSGAILIVFSIAGYFSSLGIRKIPAANPEKKFSANFVGDLFAQLSSMRGDRVLYLAVIGNTYFWFLG